MQVVVAYIVFLYLVTNLIICLFRFTSFYDKIKRREIGDYLVEGSNGLQ